MMSKPVEEVIACVVDYGTFTALADKLAETMKLVYYHSPIEEEYRNIADAVTGEGLKKAKKIEDFFEPKIFESIDLFIFPDIGYGGLQRYLRSIGKLVWGSNGADELELYRDFFIETLKDVGLPVVKSEVIYGLTALGKYLKDKKNKWVKINCYRDNMETWFHIDYNHSQRKLDSLAVIFGGAMEQVTFVVQDKIDTEIECGYDGWTVDGNFPSKSFQGYEKKNELYLGCVLEASELPEEISYVNDKMSKVLASYGYRNWWATEIRVADGVPYFIDPTCRHPGQTGEHQWETLSNIAEVIWQGAQGELIEPEFNHNFAAEATLHYEAMTDGILDEWKILEIPKEVSKWFKPYHYTIIDGIYHFTPSKKDEVGVVLGVGDSTKAALKHLEKNLKTLEHLPVYANTKGFKDLLESIIEAKKHGITFAGEIPDPNEII